jgi:hypothetical protein
MAQTAFPRQSSERSIKNFHRQRGRKDNRLLRACLRRHRRSGRAGPVSTEYARSDSCRGARPAGCDSFLSRPRSWPRTDSRCSSSRDTSCGDDRHPWNNRSRHIGRGKGLLCRGRVRRIAARTHDFDDDHIRYPHFAGLTRYPQPPSGTAYRLSIIAFPSASAGNIPCALNQSIWCNTSFTSSFASGSS